MSGRFILGRFALSSLSDYVAGSFCYSPLLEVFVDTTAIWNLVLLIISTFFADAFTVAISVTVVLAFLAFFLKRFS